MVNIWLQPIEGSLVSKLCWQETEQDTSGVVYLVYMNSVLLGQTTNTYFYVQNIREELLYQIDVVRASKTEASLYDFDSYITHTQVGNRIKVSIPKIDLKTNPDFKSYKLYYSTNDITYSELATIDGANHTTFISDELTEGLYYVKLCFLDYLGNESTPGSPYQINVKRIPVEPANVEYEYSDNKITITADAPISQHNDISGYCVFSNYREELFSEIVFENDSMLYFDTQGINFTSFPLFPGYWKFACCAIDKTGLISNFKQIDLNLDENMLEIDIPPIVPKINAIPVINGGIKVTGTGYGYTINVYCDAIFHSSDTLVEPNIDITIYDGLVDGTTYDVSVKTNNGINNAGSYSEFSHTIPVTVDSTAPTGDTELTLELIQ